MLSCGDNVIVHFLLFFFIWEDPRDKSMPYVEEAVEAGVPLYSPVRSIWATAVAACLHHLTAMWKCGAESSP